MINISFCGDWAGGESWSGYTKCQATIKSDTCEQYVAENPHDFKDVYFEINSIKVFQKDKEMGSVLDVSSMQEHLTAYEMKETFRTTTTITTTVTREE